MMRSGSRISRLSLGATTALGMLLLSGSAADALPGATACTIVPDQVSLCPGGLWTPSIDTATPDPSLAELWESADGGTATFLESYGISAGYAVGASVPPTVTYDQLLANNVSSLTRELRNASGAVLCSVTFDRLAPSDPTCLQKCLGPTPTPDPNPTPAPTATPDGATTVTRNVDCSNVTISRDYVWTEVENSLVVNFSNCQAWQVEDGKGGVLRSGVTSSGSELVPPGGFIRFRNASCSTVLRVYFRPIYPETVPSGSLLLADTLVLPASAPEMDVGPDNSGGAREHWLAGIPTCDLSVANHSKHVYSTHQITVPVAGTYTFRGLASVPPSNYLDYALPFHPIRDPFFALYQGFDPALPDSGVLACDDDLKALFGYNEDEVGERLGNGEIMEGHQPYMVANLQPGTYQLLLTLWTSYTSLEWQESWGPASVSFEMWGPSEAATPTPTPAVTPTPVATPTPAATATPGATSTPFPVGESFVQLNDRDDASSKDTYTIRARVEVAPGGDPVGDGVANGVTAVVFESGSAAGAFTDYTQVDTFTWAPSQCKAVTNGRSLYCKDEVSESFFRLRGSAAKPRNYRINTVVKRRDFVPGKPFVTPLAGQAVIGDLNWLIETTNGLCEVTHNGERTTCRLKR